MPVRENVTLAALDNLTRRGALDLQREREVATDYVRRLGVKTPSIHTPVSALSGGNQQKVALSRWLLTKPTVLVLDEPTQGIDVGAKAEIHELMTELAEQGVAILMISSELSEILGMSDRIAVMREGAIVELLDRADATQERILARALGETSPVIPTGGRNPDGAGYGDPSLSEHRGSSRSLGMTAEGEP
jgi:rhamnose transport system ATP-binding protein